MDLESTIVRAESLFKRFQRTVETIDKKGNFPSAPQARQRKPQAAIEAGLESAPSSSSAQPKASSTGTDQSNPAGEEGDTKVISPELRALLSRKVEKLDKQDIANHGGSGS
jgi:hypothetical protein